MSAAAPREKKEEVVKEEKKKTEVKKGKVPRNIRSREETRHKPLTQGMYSKKLKG